MAINSGTTNYPNDYDLHPISGNPTLSYLTDQERSTITGLITVSGTPIRGLEVNSVYNSVQAIETTLGTNPQGSYSSVADRFTAISGVTSVSGTNLIPTNGIFDSISGTNLQFKSLVAGSNITLTPSSSGISIAATAGSSISTPASTTNTALVSWSGTVGAGLLNNPVTIDSNGNIAPTVSGNSSIGAGATPFSGVYANQYATTQISGITTASTKTINWNAGGSQIVNFVGSPSGTCTITLSNGIAGSFYSLKTINNVSGTTSVAWASGTTSWPAGVPANLTLSVSAQDLYGFYYDGAKYMGNQIANFS